MNTTETAPTVDLGKDRPDLADEALESNNTIHASWRGLSLDKITPAIREYTPEAKAALIGSFRWCTDPAHPISKPEFAKRVGTSDNTLYKLYTGKYFHPEGHQLAPSAELIRNINEFLKLEESRLDGGATEFVVTPTVQKIWNACKLARESQSIVFMWGPSHIGKTWGLERFAKDNNHGRTIYIRMKAAVGVGGMVKLIAEKLGISARSNQYDMIQRIKNALNKDILLILDECHLLALTYQSSSFHKCMEILREIHDETGCGMLLGFTLLDEVRAASQKELQQLWRRGVHKVQLPGMPTKADITAIVQHSGLEFPAIDFKVEIRFRDADNKQKVIEEQPYEIIRQVAKGEALKAITERIRYARKLAKKAGAKLTWHHFVDAHLRIQKQSEPTPDWN